MKVYVKRYKLKGWVKELLLSVIVLIAMVGLFNFGSEENEEFIKNCVEAGNSQYYCERNS